MSETAAVTVTYRGGMDYGGQFQANAFQVERRLYDGRMVITVQGAEGKVSNLRFIMEPKPLAALAYAIVSVAQGGIRSVGGNF